MWGRKVREHPFCGGLCVSQGTQEKGRYAYTREVSGYQITSPLSSFPWLPLNTPFWVHFPLVVGKAYSTSPLKKHVAVVLPELETRFLSSRPLLKPLLLRPGLNLSRKDRTGKVCTTPLYTQRAHELLQTELVGLFSPFYSLFLMSSPLVLTGMPAQIVLQLCISLCMLRGQQPWKWWPDSHMMNGAQGPD